MEENITFRIVVFIKSKTEKIINNKTLKSLDKTSCTLSIATQHMVLPAGNDPMQGLVQTRSRSEAGKKHSSEQLIHLSFHHVYTQSKSLANLHFFLSLLKRNQLILLTTQQSISNYFAELQQILQISPQLL